MSIKRIILFISIISLFGCEKALIEPNPENTPVSNFEVLWKTVDEKYSFFTFKQINWDSIYQVYRPRVHNRMSDQELFDVMAEMLFQLKDGHVNLYSPFDFAYNWDWFQNYYHNFNTEILEKNYLEKNGRFTSGPLICAIFNDIGYIYYPTFADKLEPENIDDVIEKFKDLKGIIIDVRDNDGGDLNNALILASRFTDQQRLAALWYYKQGPGHDDFFDVQERYISPGGKRQFTKPISVLTNRLSYSSTNDFVLAMNQLPYVTQIGDQTGGGGGLPIEQELPNGWLYRFSTTLTLAPDGFNVEYGIAPDIQVFFTKQSEDAGKDLLIDRAIQELQ